MTGSGINKIRSDQLGLAATLDNIGVVHFRSAISSERRCYEKALACEESIKNYQGCAGLGVVLMRLEIPRTLSWLLRERLR